MIKEYKTNVFTHDGQSTVPGFGTETAPAETRLKQVKPLTVYAGYHGDNIGNWDHDFDATEDAQTAAIAATFPDAKLVIVRKPGMTDDEIRTAFRAGNVFFTWCDSDTKIRAVMGAEAVTP